MSLFFISYKRQDVNFALQVKDFVERIPNREYLCWIDREGISAGDEWKRAIDSAINQSLGIIVIVTPEALKSPYVTYEWSFAMGMGKRIIPLILTQPTAEEMHPKLNDLHGFSDDLLSVTAIAIRCPMIIAPAMDGGMYEHPATQENLEILSMRGIFRVEPEVGRFASGLVGRGRFPDTNTLIGHIRYVMGVSGDLAGHKLVVTAGGTREALDPVRYITNRSSGKQGYAIAQAGIDAGAEVTLISTAEHLPDPLGVTMVHG